MRRSITKRSITQMRLSIVTLCAFPLAVCFPTIWILALESSALARAYAFEVFSSCKSHLSTLGETFAVRFLSNSESLNGVPTSPRVHFFLASGANNSQKYHGIPRRV